MSSTFHVLPDILRHECMRTVSISRQHSRTCRETTSIAYRELKQPKSRLVWKMYLGGCAEVGEAHFPLFDHSIDGKISSIENSFGTFTGFKSATLSFSWKQFWSCEKLMIPEHLIYLLVFFQTRWLMLLDLTKERNAACWVAWEPFIKLLSL